MNWAKLVVVMTLAIMVLGLAGMLYYYNLRPILAESGNPAWQTILLPAGADSGEIAIDPKGRVWIGGSQERYYDQDGYLAVWDGSTWQEFSAEQVRQIPKVGDFGFDSIGRVWIVVPTGVAAFDGKTWTAYARQAGEDCIWSALAIDQSDRVWLGGEGCDLTVFNGNEWIKLQKGQSFSSHVSVLTVDPLGRVWVGTSQNNGLFIYDGTGWTEYPISIIPHLKDKQDSKKGIGRGVWIRDVAFDSAGRAWLATNEGLVSLTTLSAVDGKRPDWRVEIQEGPILDIEFDAAGYAYVKSFVREGLMVRDGGLWKNIEKVQNAFGRADDLPDVQTLASHPDGRIWISAHEDTGEQQRLYVLNYDQLTLLGPQAFEVGASDRLPVVALPPLALLALLLLAALLTRPVSSSLPSQQVSRGSWMRGWVLVNGLAWLTAASVLLIPLYWLGTLPTFQLIRSFMLWMPLAGVAVSAIWAAGQWIGLAAVFTQAGRWSAYTFIGTLSVYACYYTFGAIAINIFPAANEWVESNVPIEAWYFAWLLIPFVLAILGALYFVPFILTGYLTGRLQTGLLAAIAPSNEKWAQDNWLNMAVGGLFGPLVGIVYALLSGRILLPKLFGEEESK